jgi:hypothetical protein
MSNVKLKLLMKRELAARFQKVIKSKNLKKE